MAFRPDRLYAARKAKKLTQEELGKRTGLTERMIRYYEKGQYEPDSAHISLLADALEVNADYLQGRTDTDIQMSDDLYRAAALFHSGNVDALIDFLRQYLLKKGLGKKPISRHKPPPT